MTLIQKPIWKTFKPSPEKVEGIKKLTGLSDLCSTIIANRNLTTLKEIKSFLYPDLKTITPPWEIKDLEKAAQRILKAVLNNENILIYGDYDADGITSTVILYKFLKPYVKNLFYFIPHREADGYGFKVKHIDSFKSRNISLIVTVDCGSSDKEAVDYARKLNIDTIITDHHKIPDIPQNAHAVVNPWRKDCKSGLTHLAGAGVAFYLLIQLRKTMRENNFFKQTKEPSLVQFLWLCALGTIADVVPLVKENRIFVKSGLDYIKSSGDKSIELIFKAWNLDKNFISSQDIAFYAAPRINSAGRLSHAKICVELFLSDNPNEIVQICNKLTKLNEERKSRENEIVQDIEKKVTPIDLKNKILIFSSPKWNPGVLGTAAAKVARKFNRPCILVNQSDSLMKGSARSIQNISIYDIISSNKKYLTGFGGHSQAAGLALDPANFDDFSKSIINYSNTNISLESLIPLHEAEDVVLFDQLSKSFSDEMNLLEPFGQENPYPVFIAKNIIIESRMTIKAIHSRLELLQPECIDQNRMTGFIFNCFENPPSRLNQVLIKAVSDRYAKNKFNLFIEAWE
ncbi:MAG: single-stranded-DNA-specific exonuclease RecJ [Desulfobacteraceae bacterium]|nr:single-stranded-DNA-specific exonuclease RecJ [Desulfobacteraceae bacterium]MCB9494315.1 single-stranded-DNA-specific exonuclease RecJ [Desulfobacteraceae bacterium]